MQENEKNLITTTLEFDVNVKTFNKERGELIDAIVAGAKLTKADAGRNGNVLEDSIVVCIDQRKEFGELPHVTIQAGSKLTKADAGKTA